MTALAYAIAILIVGAAAIVIVSAILESKTRKQEDDK